MIKKRKTSLQPITAERFEFLFLIPFLSTITSRTAADNNGGDNNNHAVNVVEKLSHLILISFEISLTYHLFSLFQGEKRKNNNFFDLELAVVLCSPSPARQSNPKPKAARSKNISRKQAIILIVMENIFNLIKSAII